MGQGREDTAVMVCVTQRWGWYHSAVGRMAESLRRLRRAFSGRYRAKMEFYDKVSIERGIALKRAENERERVSLKTGRMVPSLRMDMVWVLLCSRSECRWASLSMQWVSLN